MAAPTPRLDLALLVLGALLAGLTHCGDDEPSEPSRVDDDASDGAFEDGRVDDDAADGAPEVDASTDPVEEPQTDALVADLLDADAPDAPDDAGGTAPLALFDGPLAVTPPPLTSAEHPLAPSALWADPTGPLPTCTWWLNLVMGGGTNPVNQYPYVVRALESGLSVSQPATTVGERTVSAFTGPTLRLSASELPGPRQVTAWDDLAVTLVWSVDEGTMTVPLVRGSPYATALYAGLTPLVATTAAIESASNDPDGRRVVLALADGTTWVVYASAVVEWTVSASQIVATAAFDGSVRVAFVGTGDGARALLDAHAGAIPVGGTVEATSEGNRAALAFVWDVQGEAPLLTMALPHHLATLTTPTDAGLTYTTLRGPLTAVVGASWTFDEPLSPIAWAAPTTIDPERRPAVEEALEDDVELVPVASDPYFFGKQIAAVARLALIADELGRDDLATPLRATLTTYLEPWVTGARADPLIYDETWGGVVVRSGLDNPGAHFGQGYYNDHHFHYGYHIYAAAVLAREAPDWLAEHREYVLALIRDIGNPSPDDPYFTVFRHKDWYTGHSWASGLFDLPLSRNQESTSEAVNAYYAMSLWGRVSGDQRLTDLGRLALATEIRAARTYWQIGADSPVYPAPFAERGAVGILWDLLAQYAVFFGPNEEYIFGIQMLPFTPITEALLDPAWVAHVDPLVSAILVRNDPPVNEGWRGLLLMNRAVIAPDLAWLQAASLGGYDDGNSRTNTLYWIATRP